MKVTTAGKTEFEGRRILMVIAMLMAFLDGVLAFVFPVLFPVFKEQFQCNLEQLGRVQLVYYMSQLIYCFFALWLVNRLGFIKLLCGALIISAASLTVIGSASSFGMLLAGVTILGLSETVFFVTGSTIISIFFKHNQSTIFFVFGVMLSAGSVLNSLALGKWLAYSESSKAYWGFGVWLIAAFLLAVFIFIIVTRKITSFIESVNFRKDLNCKKEYSRLLSNKKLWSVGMALMLYCMAYIGILSWIGQLYQKRFGIDGGQASAIISLYLTGFMAGRAIFYLISKKTKIAPMKLVAICAVSAVFSIILSITAPNLVFGQVLILISGIFLSANVPAILSAVGDIFNEGNTFAAYNFNMMVFSVSYGAGPYIIGFIGSKLSLELSIWTAPLFGVLLVIAAVMSAGGGNSKHKSTEKSDVSAGA